MINFTQIKLSQGDLLLRDRLEADIADYIRWNTVETEWSDWDAPWEPLEGNMAGLEKQLLTRLAQPLPEIRFRLEVCYAGRHLGWVNRYNIDQDLSRIAVGISLPEKAYWGQGIGEKALRLWTAYLFEKTGTEALYCETWSGNQRMIRLAEKCGFAEVHREPNLRLVRGERYDGLRFKLKKNQISLQNETLKNSL